MTADAQPQLDDELTLARQFGHLFVSEPDPQRVLDDFNRVFKGHRQALEQFDAGAQAENQKRLALGLSPTEFHAYHQKLPVLSANKRRSHGGLQSHESARAD
ncbi:hypothetical protein D9M73_294290 [compost metagenome]|jgi:hypothetical protein